VATLAALALGFLLPPTINLKHFRAVLSQSLSRSLDRQASVQEVRLRLLPLPGFTFRRLRISDDEEFGAEPILQTQEDGGQYSVATLHLASLWRGRLEIASVSLTQASLNLVRAPDGHWNLERLINRAAEVPSAPTSKKKPETRTRFPYIELKDSRINFKFGAEKKPFTLSESEFALWLAAENRWNVRLRAVPLRTDENISDTGVIKLAGSFDRASRFDQTPFHFQVSWERPEVNAIMRIVRGNDPGWRGAVDLHAELRGTPVDFTDHFSGNIDEFRRYDIARNSSLDLRINCDQHFHTAEGTADSALDFRCKLPLSSGALMANGNFHFGNGSPEYSARLFASEVPVATLVQAMLHAKSTLPADLTGEGRLDGDWSIVRAHGSSVVWKGALAVANAALHSSTLGSPLIFPQTVTLTFEPPTETTSMTSRSQRKPMPQITPARAVLEDFSLDLGGKVEVSASFDLQGYRMNMTGPADLKRLMQAGRAIGLHPPTTDLEGSGLIAAQYSGEWSHFAPPVVSGQLQIRSAVLSVRGFSEPLTVSAGSLKFTGPNFEAEKLDAVFARSGFSFVGNFSGTRQCEHHVICDVTFSLQTDQLDEKVLLGLLSPPTSSGISLPFFSSGHRFDAKWLLEIPSSGTITARHLVIRNVSAKNASAQLQLSSGKVLVHHFTADLFDGKHDGDWTFDFSGPSPRISGEGFIRRARIEMMHATIDEQTATGMLDIDYRLMMSGSNFSQIVASASGGGTFSWHNGSIQNVKSDEETPVNVHFGNWSGHFMIEKQQIALQSTTMDSSSGVQEVTGEISFNQPWNLKFIHSNGMGLADTGAIASPVLWNAKTTATEAPR
jgi:AsmA protein